MKGGVPCPGLFLEIKVGFVVDRHGSIPGGWENIEELLTQWRTGVVSPKNLVFLRKPKGVMVGDM